MLEAQHLTKIYKTKGGADVKALDDVSIQFSETGMVFLLGKSGSGKSTLLNVCGGLDEPTSGSILVKGKSSETFSQSDFDSYRNTYVGFIFQEYNILNEFSVEDNIALALELQGKPKDKQVIADLLEQVELTGYAKRKPNTLSGGQKQRIAIARALVKSPEIIMADEPTGALDSATGKQVFDTLKKLSKEKLVIVVSHDRDFAEMYGDRIIELKDGKIISDVTKTEEQQQVLTQNISIVGDTLCVKNGSDLSEEDFAQIKEFLSKTDKDVIIASGDNDVKAVKEVCHIKDSGEKEVFRDSEEIPIEKKEYSPQDSRFIRSKLPLRHAIKIGVSGMKTKPLRLIFTILLCTVAFVFFGLLSTMTFYNSEATFKQSLEESDYGYLMAGKVYRITEKWFFEGVEDEYDYSMETSFTEEELDEYQELFGADTFGGVSTWSSVNIQSYSSNYWTGDIRMMAYMEETNSLRERINGRYPEKEDEICISSYTADVLYYCRAYEPNTGKLLELSSPEDILGKQITFEGQIYTVVGIMDSGKIPEKYDELKEAEDIDYQLYNGLQYELQDGLHLIAFVSKERLADVAGEEGYYGMHDFSEHRMVVTAGLGTGGDYIFPEWDNAGYAGYSKYATADQVLWLESGKTEPAENEVIISKSLFNSLVSQVYLKEMNAAIEAGDTVKAERCTEIYELATLLCDGGVYVENQETKEWEFLEFTQEEADKKQNELLNALQKEEKSLTLAVKFFDSWEGVQMGEVKEFAIAGVWNSTVHSDYEELLFSDKIAESLWESQKENMNYYAEYTSVYVEPENAIYSTIVFPFDHSQEQVEMLWDIYNQSEYDEDGSMHTLTSQLIMQLETVDSIIEEFSKIFLIAGIVLAIFAALLLSNFISVSISYKKQEIGILRAVGARSLDVFKIFFSESFVITAICVVISTIGSIVCCAVINEMLMSMLSASLLVFGSTSFLVLLLVAIITAVVATFLPVWNAAKKKPVESIRSL